MADPIQGLINFVLAQKPYHTKILDLLVNYVHEDEVNATITEEALFEIGMVIGAEFSDMSGTPESIVETCPGGFGDGWDQSAQFLVVYADAGPDIIYVIGDQTTSFTAGVEFEVRDPDQVDPDLNFIVDTDATYDALTDRTAIPVTTAVAATFIDVADPGNNDSTVGDVFVQYSLTSTTALGNVLVIEGPGININDFIPGFAIDVSNASDPALEIGYRIAAAVETGPNQVTVFSITNVPLDGGTGDVYFAGAGYDEPTFCSSSEQTVVKPFFTDDIFIQTFTDDTLTTELFQYFVVAADSVANTFTVEGDVRTTLTPGTNFQVVHTFDWLSPPTQIPLINGVFSHISPEADRGPNGNDGAYTVDGAGVTYNPVTNRSIIPVTGSVTTSAPTGFIIPV